MSWLTWPFRIAWFALWYAWQLLISNVAVLKDNLTPGQDSTPGIARLVTRCRTDLEVTLLAALITLTPGTLTIGNERSGPDGSRVLYVHGLYCADAEELRAELRDMESHLLHALRRTGVAS
ncbi:Na+/H+ antiporter subunit E [Georgenia sp. Z1344]|uniref:Na+/H+ antiporter subunit E n=1 Tax=Georgenia sp. Z1344 TaxID=3416706 RepID=UPI003CE72A3A